MQGRGTGKKLRSRVRWIIKRVIRTKGNLCVPFGEHNTHGKHKKTTGDELGERARAADSRRQSSSRPATGTEDTTRSEHLHPSNGRV